MSSASTSSTVRRSQRLSKAPTNLQGFSVTSLSSSSSDDSIHPNGCKTLDFLYKPHSILVLVGLMLGLVYTAFFHTSATSAFDNAVRGIAAAVVSFLFIGVTQFGDGPFIRPHPALWRLVLSVSIVYLLFLIVLLFQTVGTGRQWMGLLDPALGVALTEKTYAEECSLTWANLADKMDMFVPAHLFGWVAKALILRDAWLCWVLSVMFEVMEYSLEFQLPNFGECWWDHWILDVLICNWAGIVIGMAICRLLSMRTYNWRSIRDIQSISGKVRRGMEQLTPHSWTSFDWASTRTFKGYLVTLVLVAFFLLSELNAFYLKALLWIPPPHWINVSRVVLHGLMGMVAVRELYQYFADPSCKKLGAQLWVTFAVITVETLIVIKFGAGILPTAVPPNVVKFWGGFVTFLIAFPIIRFGRSQQE